MKLILCYVVKQMILQQKIGKRKPSKQVSLRQQSALLHQTHSIIIFKVLLKFKDGESIESDTSDPIMTMSLMQPGKPRASIITESHGRVLV